MLQKLLLILFLSPILANGQVITTFAGNGGAESFSALDSVSATDAALWLPFGVTAANGNVYISEYGACRVRVVNADDIIATLPGAYYHRLDDPVKVAIDTAGKVFIADMGYSVITKISKAGIMSTFAGIEAGGAGAYSGDNGPATAAQLNQPSGVAVDTNGNVFIADAGNNRIRKVNASGIISTVAGTGAYGYSGDNGPASAAKFANCEGVYIAPSGTIYVADAGNSRIRIINSAGIIVTVAGSASAGYSGDGGPATAAQLHGPCQLAFDDHSNMYIADYDNYCIRKVDAAGNISTFAGCDTAGFSGDGGDARLARINSPQDVSVDAAGNVYIADFINQRIRVVSSTPSTGTRAVTGNRIISISPNPATTSLNITSGSKIDQLTITNLSGQAVYHGSFNSEQIHIDLSAFSSGAYLITINGSDTRQFIKK